MLGNRQAALGHRRCPLGGPYSCHRRDIRTTQRASSQQPAIDSPPRVLLPGLDNEIALTREPSGPGFIPDDMQPSAPWQRPADRTYTGPSIRSSGTLRPGPEWFPAWMKYRRREDNAVFWQDKFLRCSLEIPAAEKRWTVFSSFWFLVMECKYFGIPPALRYIFYLAWRAIMQQVYQTHKAVVLWQSKLDAALAARALRNTASSSSGSSSADAPSGFGSSSSGGGVGGSSSSGGGTSTSSSSGGGDVANEQPLFSRAMALRRLHWKNSLFGEVLYLINVAKTGRVHMLPPEKTPLQRPTFFFLF